MRIKIVHIKFKCSEKGVGILPQILLSMYVTKYIR